jgi:hypothetical protein
MSIQLDQLNKELNQYIFQIENLDFIIKVDLDC